MHSKYFSSNHPGYILCHVENNITSILFARVNSIVQNMIAVVMFVMLN